MTTLAELTTAKPVSSTNGSAPEMSKPRRRVPPLLVGVGLGIAALAVFVWLTPAGLRSTRVLVLSRPLAAGATISTADLRVVSLAVPKGLQVVPASDEGQLVGQTALVDMASGSLLVAGELGQPGSSGSIVGVALKAGQFPPGLAAGQRVEVVAVPSGSGLGSAGAVPAGTVLAPNAVVESLSAISADTSITVVGLSVSGPESLAIAQANATGQVDLVAIP